MAQSESLPAPASPVARPLPMESFLATEDPAWVWDGQGRRILWANAAAAKLWGDATPERLKRRRQGHASTAPARLTELARSDAPLADATETLAIPTPNGRVEVSCILQRLKLAGNRPGLVVRVLGENEKSAPPENVAMHPAARASFQQTQPSPQRATNRKRASRSELGTLKSIAKDIGNASGRPHAQSVKSATQQTSPPASGDTKPKAAKPPKKQLPKTPSKPGAPTGRPADMAAKAQSARTRPGSAAAEPPSPEEMTVLLGRVSHEIRNPLTIILGFAEILQSDRIDRLPPGKAKEYASDIYRTAQLALGLADDLLGFAERASGEPPPPHDWVDLNALITDCLHLLEPLAAAHGVRLARRLKRDSPWLLAHERSIRQVLLNLLMNALRHGDGGGVIRVFTRIDRDGGLVLSVKDEGPGMTWEQIAAAKAPEQAGDVKRAGRRGLGLRLVLGFVRDNAGELDIISKPGAGADVRIRFGPDRLRHETTGNTAPKKKKTASKTKQQALRHKQAAPKKRAAKRTARQRA